MSCIYVAGPWYFILFGINHLTGGYFCPGFYLVCTGSIWYEFLAFRQPAWLCVVAILCFISVVLGGGSTGQW